MFINAIRKTSWIILLLIISVGEVFSQTKVSGIVTGADNEPLIGVNIIVKGSQTGTVSDVDGKYEIQVPDGKAALIFSYLGYKTAEQPVGTSSTINIRLKEDSQIMEEVVVVAYGTQQKSHLTGAVASLKNDRLDEVAYSRVDQVMQGKIAGVRINNSDPTAGSAPQIRVRGMASISASQNPLVVVDGFPLPNDDGNAMASVSMNDVESIEVLKDAASAALYGSRAAGGVILITTKAGSSSKAQYSFKMYTGVKTVLKVPDILGTDAYVKRLYDEAALRMQDPAVDGVNMRFNMISDNERAMYLILHNYTGTPTDWVQEGLRSNGLMQNYQLAVSGGNKDVKYYLSGGYNGEKGIMKFSDYNKYTFRSKIDAKLSKKVSVGMNIAPTISKKVTPGNDFVDFPRFRDYIPVRHNAATAALTGKSIGDFAQVNDFSNLNLSGIGYNGEVWNLVGVSPWTSGNNTPVTVNNLSNITTDDYSVQSNAYLSLEIIPGLIFKTSDGFFGQYKEYNDAEQTAASKPGVPNQLNRQLTFHTELLTENTLTYTKSFNKQHNLQILAGFTAQKSNDRYNAILGTSFPSDDMMSFNLTNTFVPDDGSNLKFPFVNNTTSFYYGDALVSVLGRINYDYLGKYLASVSFRTDGSSKFAQGHKWGSFPGASVGWRVSEESFMKPLEWLSNFKLRASYGVTGNNSIPQYAYMNTVGAANYALGAGMVSLPQYALANPDITWEQTKEANYGMDLGFLNNRFSLSVDYYNSETRALLLKQPTMLITGHMTAWNNIGRVQNRGLEIEVNTTEITNKNFTWKTSANFSTNKNKLLSLGGQDQLITTGARGDAYIAIVGQPSIQFYGYKTAGVYTTFEEVQAALYDPNTGNKINYGQFTPTIGGIKVLPREGADGNLVVDAGSRQTLGTPYPNFIWGMTNTLSYKDFDLSIAMQGSQGGKLWNGYIYYGEQTRYNTAYMKNRYVSPMFPGDGKTPAYSANGIGTSAANLCITDYAIEDASYAVLRDVSLGYTLPKRIMQKIGLNSLRIYASGQNLVYLMGSNYRGINPEARKTGAWLGYDYGSPLVDGFQSGAFPLARTYSLGLDLQF